MTTKKKPAPRKAAVKKATNKQIQQAAIDGGSKQVRVINQGMKVGGFHPIDTKRRDSALRKFDFNQIQKNARKEGSGGKRPGSGRKVGAVTKKTREAAEKAIDSGEMLPLDYLLGVMRATDEDLKKQHDSGEIDTETYLVKLKFNMSRRDNAAEKAAPFVHARLASVQAEIIGSEADQWVAFMEEAGIE